MPSQPLRVGSLFAVAALIGVGASCDKTPTSPRTPAATIVRILSNAPYSIAPGAAVRLTATALKSDGTTEDVTSGTSWMSTNAPVLEVGSDGLATGRERGEAEVHARYQSFSASRLVVVLPDGTFKLVGQVAESGAALEDATVTVTAGTGAGQIAVTSFRGYYAIYGVAGRVTLEAKKSGYNNQIVEITVDRPQQGANFNVSLAGGRPNVAGTYELTVTADAECAAALPPEARRRRYTATVTQDGVELSVVMSDADYVVTNGTGDRFNGRVTFDGVRFFLMDELYYYYTGFAIIERFSATALLVHGLAAATATSTGYSGRLGGTIGVASRSDTPFYPLTASCHAGNHGFEMRRR